MPAAPPTPPSPLERPTHRPARTALVLVSHSAALAAGAAELAAQMAPGVTILSAGGLDDGGLGTSYDLVESRLRAALEAVVPGGAGEPGGAGGAAGVVVLADLGSAVLTVESVLEMEEELTATVHLAVAPFVEGAVAAAVAAAGGADAPAVLAAAERAGAGFAGRAAPEPGAGTPPAPGEASGAERAPGAEATVTVRNPQGLHARPAASLARLAAGFDAAVRVDGVDAASVLALMELGVTAGHELAVTASGPQARQAVAAVVAAVEEGFGEV